MFLRRIVPVIGFISLLGPLAHGHDADVERQLLQLLIKERIARIQATLEQPRTEDLAAKSRTELEQRLAAQIEENAWLLASQSANIANLKKLLEDATASFQSQGGTLAEVSATNEALVTALRKLGTRLDQIDARLDTLSDKTSKLGSQITAVSAKVEENTRAMKRQQAAQDEMADQIKANQAALADRPADDTAVEEGDEPAEDGQSLDDLLEQLDSLD